jgi:hypothetical protein
MRYSVKPVKIPGMPMAEVTSGKAQVAKTPGESRGSKRNAREKALPIPFLMHLRGYVM